MLELFHGAQKTNFQDEAVEVIHLTPGGRGKNAGGCHRDMGQWTKKDAYCAKAVGIMKDYFKEVGRIK